ncbi:MAG: TrkH family potassium uptake protein [Candidatus Aminicenantales bacterium]
MRKEKSFQPAQVLAISFVVTILVGTFLLMLPFSTTLGRISFIDALFTSTSAVCVTGLTVQDTPSYFSPAGQVILLLLFQLGGLGIMTFSTMVLLAAGRKIAITERILVQEGFHPGFPRDIKTLIKNIFFFTFSIEFIGFVLLYLRFYKDYPRPRALFSSIFHAVSAFCNAGFSLNSDSLMPYRGDILVNLTIIVLILLGGLGFIVIREMTGCVLRFCRGSKMQISLHSKLVLSVSGFLIGSSFLVFIALEWNRALVSFSLKEKILSGLFQVITPRTAGFNTIDLKTLGPATLLLLLLLMFVGASPGSTGGGVKTSTFGVVLAFIRARLKARDSVHLFYRSIPQENVMRAFTLILLSMSLIVVSSFVVLIQQPQALMRDILFEVFSAFGTVGLSLGMTSHLDSLSKAILVLTMYAGRVGPLTLLYAFSRRKPLGKYDYVEEKVMIG